jgi:hypothetical protein
MLSLPRELCILLQRKLTLTHLALPLTCGLSTPELAGRVGQTTTWVASSSG